MPTITAGESPPLIYDYHGFPAEAYEITYPAPGDPHLARRLQEMLSPSGIEARLDPRRGFDHGLFVPLKVIYPEADIPCVQLSLVRGLDPEEHLLPLHVCFGITGAPSTRSIGILKGVLAGST